LENQPLYLEAKALYLATKAPVLETGRISGESKRPCLQTCREELRRTNVLEQVALGRAMDDEGPSARSAATSGFDPTGAADKLK